MELEGFLREGGVAVINSLNKKGGGSNYSGEGYLNDNALNRKLIDLVSLADIHKWFHRSSRWVGLELLMRTDFAWVFATRALAMGLIIGGGGEALRRWMSGNSSKKNTKSIELIELNTLNDYPDHMVDELNKFHHSIVPTDQGNSNAILDQGADADENEFLYANL